MSKYEKILVTGGAGFIGSHIVDRLIDENLDVTVIDNLDTGKLENIAQHKHNKNFHFIKGDIRDSKLINEIITDIDAVFHEAALASVMFSVKNPILSHQINVDGTLNLLKAASDANVKRFIFASSAAVYGNPQTHLKQESATPNPTSPYGVTKLAAESYVRVFHSVYGLETVSLRYFNVYGPRQSFDIQCAYGGAITIFTNRLMKNMSPIIYGDGNQTRDFVNVKDVVNANILALYADNISGDFFNIGTGKGTSLNQIAEILKELLNKKEIKNVYADSRPTDIRHGYADLSKAKLKFDYNPTLSIKKGLTELINWYIKDKQNI